MSCFVTKSMFVSTKALAGVGKGFGDEIFHYSLVHLFMFLPHIIPKSFQVVFIIKGVQ